MRTVAIVIAGISLPAPLWSQSPITVATYKCIPRCDKARLRKNCLQSVISILGTDVIGLQEIDDHAALLEIFHPAVWDVVIDEGSDLKQDIALSVPAIRGTSSACQTTRRGR